jgi:plastocyanin
MGRRLLLAACCALALLALSASAASAQTLKYRFGPIEVAPGQNTIDFKPNNLRPQVPGYITAFRPNLTYLNGKVPGVDVVHLHHGVWLVDLQPTWAAGEEKTNAELPAGYGWRYDPSQNWVMNYMVHNLTPTPTQVYLTYEIDFVPDSDPAAASIRTVATKWMDVQFGHVYPVFDALRANSKRGRYTFPTDDPTAYRTEDHPLNTWTADEDGTLVWTAGHLHPGGLHTDLYLTRGGQRTRVFRSDAHYFEPAGAVSWDVAMTNTAADWRVQVRKGDVLTVTGTYDTSKASWYESMAIMPVAFSPGDPTGIDPFSGKLDTKGVLNHGHLAENDNHGGGPGGLPDARGLPGGILITGSGKPVFVQDFQYGLGDLTRLGRAGRPPTVRQGASITFRNLDDGKAIWHTITACRAPCSGRTGIAYPLANATVDFDSGELGTGPPGRTAAANRLTWKTPRTLAPGTYTYFCRIHPFMRGAFRVVPR